MCRNDACCEADLAIFKVKNDVMQPVSSFILCRNIMVKIGHWHEIRKTLFFNDLQIKGHLIFGNPGLLVPEGLSSCTWEVDDWWSVLRLGESTRPNTLRNDLQELILLQVDPGVDMCVHPCTRV